MCQDMPGEGINPSFRVNKNKLFEMEMGILSSRREGKSVYYRITNDEVIKILKCADAKKEIIGMKK